MDRKHTDREIERKFLVVSDGWKGGPGRAMRQGYLSRAGEVTVRVRQDGERAFLTVKGLSAGPTRPEYEYEIPPSDLEGLFRLCGQPLIEKTRHEVDHAGHRWEVDVFGGVHAGLVLAEVELTDADEAVDLPPWVGAEVTDDLRYRNASLAEDPVTPPA